MRAARRAAEAVEEAAEEAEEAAAAAAELASMLPSVPAHAPIPGGIRVKHGTVRAKALAAIYAVEASRSALESALAAAGLKPAS